MSTNKKHSKMTSRESDRIDRIMQRRKNASKQNMNDVGVSEIGVSSKKKKLKINDFY
jgi:hypothetical protein